MNSFHEQWPNNDCKQCTELKLGWVYSAHTQSPGRAHTARAVPRSWALLRAQLTGRAHVVSTASACRTLAGVRWSRHTQAAYPRSRPHFDVATTRQPESCRDIKSMSRHRFSCPAPSQVATPEPGRDPPGDSLMSRHQFHVATSFPNRPGRDVSSMSRPPGDLTYVATSNPCRDLPHCRPCRDIKSMSRHRFCPQWDFQVATPKARSRPPTLLPMSRPQKCCRDINSAQPHFCYVVTPFFPCHDLPCCHPCRDLKMMSRHQFSLAKIPGRPS